MAARRSNRRWSSAPARPALPYYGSKWRLYSWIRELLPPHDLYCEPFGGAAAVLLRKEPAKIEVYNDLDGQVVNFFRVLRDHTQRSELLARLELTPYSKEEFEIAHQTSGETLDSVDEARLLFIRGWQGFGSSGASSDSSTGWRRGNASSLQSEVRRWLAAIPNLGAVAERLRQVQVEHDSAWAVLDRYDSPGTLFYIDPPYVEATLSANKPYRHGFKEADHRRLADVLHSRQGMVLLSGFACPLYDELFGDWERRQHQALTVGIRAGGERAHRTEVVWLNPALAARVPAAPSPAFPQE